MVCCGDAGFVYDFRWMSVCFITGVNSLKCMDDGLDLSWDDEMYFGCVYYENGSCIVVMLSKFSLDIFMMMYDLTLLVMVVDS